MSDTPDSETTTMRINAEDLAEAQIQARACWYYYVGAMTQQEIADRLGLTRLKVNKLLGQARQDGLVSVEIKLPLANCVALKRS